MSNSSGTRQERRLPVFNQFLQRLEEIPLPKPEDSILLRALVQAMVAVGIIATDIAAETHMSLWAVPLSIIGATWSWYRRRDRNVPTKFCIAIGMLLALAAFFGNLLANLNDTRLVLAQLLIQLQVLHSFDMPRRKDLGYSMVIGLILLGVAGTLSQTLAFAPMLLVFLAIALPVLVLDYRSRLGLLYSEVVGTPKRRTPLLASDLSWRRLGIFLLVIVTLGLTIFAVMPRFPGYQLQSLPVSTPIKFTGEFSGRAIVNPGYANKGKRRGAGGGSGTDTQEDEAKGPGKMDDTFYYGFGSKINQNLRGELKPKVVMRVRSQTPGFWRVLGFDRYTGQGWEISRNEDVEKLFRPEWSYRFYIPISGVVGRTKQIIQSYTVVSELPNLIPALSYPRQLFFPTEQVAVDKEGSIRSPVGLTEELTYTVISEVPYRDRTLLGQASTKYSENIRKYYLQVPPEIVDKVRKRTQEILATSPKPATSVYEQALYLTQYLKQHYTLPKDPLGLPYFGENEDLVEAFLFKNQGGYPDHFSTVLTVMLRSIGIPARLVAGFAPGQFNPFTGLYIVRNVDAYAMTEVYFPKYGWFAFDPIPTHPLIPPSVEEDQTFGVLGQFWKWVAGWLPTPVTSWLNWVFELLMRSVIGAIAWFIALFSEGWVGLFTALIVTSVLGFLGWLGWNQLRTWRYRRWLASLPQMESIYQQMVSTLGTKGYAKHPASTPLEYAEVARRHHSPKSAEAIDEISQAYVSWRYGRHRPNLYRLQQRLQELIKSSQQPAASSQLLGKLRNIRRGASRRVD
jgi:transglutaminase-like putative cysteine protease